MIPPDSQSIPTGSHELNPALAVLDLRLTERYFPAHHDAATHLPFAALVLRRHELPLPGTALQLLHDDAEQLQQATQQLQLWGYPVVHTALITAELLQQWQQQLVLRQGSASRQLWQANGTLLRAFRDAHIPGIVSLSMQKPGMQKPGMQKPGMQNPSTQSPQPRRALDLACGSGRDALALAGWGYTVLAIDHKPDALERLQASAAALGMAVDMQCVDIEAADFSLPPAAFDLISVARYLHRPLLPRLREWLAPGGVLTYETFARGAEKFSGPKRPEFLLEPGELATCFCDWHILHDDIETLADGRPMQSFIARKPLY